MPGHRNLFCGLLLWAGVLCAQDIARDAGAARENNQPEEAIDLYRGGVAQNPNWTEGWWYLGTLLYDRDDYSGAASAFGRAAALDPKRRETWVMLGLSEARLQENAAALEHLRQGRRLGLPDDPQLRHVMFYNLGMLWLDLGDERGGFDHAQEALDVLAGEGVDSEELTTALGLAVLRMKPPPKDPALVRAAGAAEILAADRSKATEALHAYQALAATYPKVSGVQFAYGKFLVANHFDEQAVTAFQRELQNSPKHLLARLGIAGLKTRADPAGALPYAEEAVKLAPELPEAHYVLGFILLELNDSSANLSRAIAELETARRAEPNAAKVYFALNRAYTRANRPVDAARARSEFARLDKQADARAFNASNPP